MSMDQRTISADHAQVVLTCCQPEQQHVTFGDFAGDLFQSKATNAFEMVVNSKVSQRVSIRTIIIDTSAAQGTDHQANTIQTGSGITTKQPEWAANKGFSCLCKRRGCFGQLELVG